MGKEDGGGIPLPRFTFLRGEENAVRDLARDLDQKTSHLVFDLKAVMANSILSDLFIHLNFSPLSEEIHSLFKKHFGQNYRMEAFQKLFIGLSQNSIIFINYEEEEIHYLYSQVKYHSLIEIEVDENRRDTPWLSFPLKTNPEHSTLYILESVLIQDFPGKERLHLYDG